MPGSGTYYVNKIVFDDGSETASVFGVPKVYQYTFNFSDFSEPSLTDYIDIIEDFRQIVSIELKPTIAFSGTGVTELKSFIGTPSDPYFISSEWDLLAPVSDSNYQIATDVFLDGSTPIRVSLESVGANLDQLSQGQIMITIKYYS
jgi:hypothetical protein